MNDDKFCNRECRYSKSCVYYRRHLTFLHQKAILAEINMSAGMWRVRFSHSRLTLFHIGFIGQTTPWDSVPWMNDDKFCNCECRYSKSCVYYMRRLTFLNQKAILAQIKMSAGMWRGRFSRSRLTLFHFGWFRAGDVVRRVSITWQFRANILAHNKEFEHWDKGCSETA